MGIKDRICKFPKTSTTYKDFGKFFYKVQINVFYNYTTIFVSLFGKKAPDFYAVLANFYNFIYKLSIVYDWQEVVLSIAIKVHIFIVAKQPTGPQNWVISKKFQGKFCTPRMLKKMSSILEGKAGNKTKRSRFLIIFGYQVKNGSNNLLVTCKIFNKGGYNQAFYKKAYEYKNCRSKDHGQIEYELKKKKKN